MTGTPSDGTPDSAPETTAPRRESRWAVAAAAFLCVLWIGFVAFVAVVFGEFRCLGDSNGPAPAVCEAGSATQTIVSVVGFVLPVLAAVAAGAFGVWRRSFRPVTLTAALLWLFPPAAVVLIVELTTPNM